MYGDNIQQDLIYTGQRIRQKRKEVGMSQDKLAAKINVTVNTIYRIENAQMIMKVDKLYQLVEALDTSIEELCPQRLVTLYQKTAFEKLSFEYCRLSEGNRKVVYDTTRTLIYALLNQQRH